MTTLIACLSTGQGTWGHVKKLVEDQQWDKIIIVTDHEGKEKFKANKPVEFILINKKLYLQEIVWDLEAKLKEKIKDIEVGVNLISGSGKEHMALMSALIKLGVGIRFVALTKDGVKEI